VRKSHYRRRLKIAASEPKPARAFPAAGFAPACAPAPVDSSRFAVDFKTGTYTLWRVNMNRLAKLLPLDKVLLGLSVTSKKRVFEQAGLIFENNNGIARSVVTDNLFARERLGSTGLGEGVAIPHGRIKGLKHPLAAFVRLAEPIPFESPDGQPVGLLIFLLVPEQATQQHLEILSEIAQLLSDRDTRERLATEPDAESVHAFLTQWQP
jgi:PTS system nitrogen regulatory IIA component